MLNLIAQLKNVKATRKASEDIEYQVTFVTDNPNVLKLGEYTSEMVFDLEVRPE